MSFTCPVCKFDVLSHRTWVCVAFTTAGDLAGIWLTSDVCLHVLCSVAGVVEALAAFIIVAYVWLLPGVGPHMEL